MNRLSKKRKMNKTLNIAIILILINILFSKHIYSQNDTAQFLLDQYNDSINQYIDSIIDNSIVYDKSGLRGYYKNQFFVEFDSKQLQNLSTKPNRDWNYPLNAFLSPKDIDRIRQRLPKKVRNNKIWIRYYYKNSFRLIIDCMGMEKKVLKSLRSHFPLILIADFYPYEKRIWRPFM